MREVKKIIVNTLASTCLILLLLVLVAIIIEGVSIHNIGENTIQVSIFLQILAASILINIGLYFTHKIEVKYAFVKIFLDISFLIIIILVFGAIFDWFSTRKWILLIMSITFYSFGIFTNIFRTRQDAIEINELLQKRKKKNKDTAC